MARIVATLLLLVPFTAAPTTARTAVNATPAAPAAPARGTKDRSITADLSLPASPAAVRPHVGREVSRPQSPRTGGRPSRPATRDYRRPPIAEETRWRSTSRRHAATLSAPKPLGRTSLRSTEPRPATGTDLDRARALPEPWRSIVRCESLRDGSWRVGSSSRARGWFQFLPSTWRSLGLHGDPARAPFESQYAAARELRARDGLGAWDCARILGYVVS